MNYSNATELLKAEIKQACNLLQGISEEYYSPLGIIVQNIIRMIDNNEAELPILTKDFEQLAVFLLLKTTTKLESIRSNEIHSIAKEIFQRIKDLDFSEAIANGIHEFLDTPEPNFNELQVQKEIEILSQQIQEILNQYRNKKTIKRATQTPNNSIQDIKAKTQRIMNSGDQKNQVILSMNTLKDERNNQGEITSFKSITTEQEKNIKLQSLQSFELLENDRKSYSFCILDVQGNFSNLQFFICQLIFIVMADKKAETLFEIRHEELLKSNLFSLMIPLSLFYLKKKLGESIFSSLGSQSKTFSYTIYSNHALKRYQKELTRMNRKDESVRKKVNNQKFSVEEKDLLTEDNSIYYKYLQTLTSRATLIELKFSKVDDLIKLENMQDVKVKLEHEIFRDYSEVQGTMSQPAVLLVTRKAYHVQKFKYSLMEKYDENIIKMEEKILKKLSKKVAKIAKKDQDFEVKVELNNTINSYEKPDTEIFQEEDTPSP